MRKIVSFLLVGVAVLMTFGVKAQLEFPEDKVSWSFSVQQNGDEATIIGKITMVEHWHIYAANLPEDNMAIPTEIELTASDKYKAIGGVIEPKPIFEHDELADEDLYYHSNTVLLKRKIKVLSDKDFEIKGVFSFQTCDDTHCLPPHYADFTVKVKGVKANVEEELIDQEELDEEIEPVVDENEEELSNDEVNEDNESGSATPVDETNDNEGGDDDSDSDKSLITIFLLSFASGLAALLTPCVFPMIPMTVSFFTKQSKTRAKGIRNAIMYGISIIVIYILLGTLVTAIFGAEVLNEMSTNPTFNIVFFLILVVFAISFMGAFEIRMPSKWVNKADSRADKGGIIGIFFMALALALVSFSCTGPIVGSLLVTAATEGGLAPFIGMFGFSLALALPFALFAAFPGWMNTLPKSGGWLNTVKVVLGFLELALAFKFLSNADLAVQGHFLEREVFLAIWIGIFLVLALYLFGFLTLPHDSKVERLSVGRTLLGTTVVIFVLYMLPGLWGAPLKLISAFPPPLQYAESPLGVGGSGEAAVADHGPEGTHLGPQNIWVFHDYDKALAYAQQENKPLFVDFTGHNCVNCRKMEQSVWGEPGVIEILRDEVVVVSLHVDERTELPESEQKTVTYAGGRTKKLKTVGDKWMIKQISEYNATAQPYYIMQNTEGEDISKGPATFENHSDPSDFKKWLKESIK
jgi:thiol:disulfide interchange protein DsbD